VPKKLDLKQYVRVRREAERQRREVERARGALDQFRAMLQERYDCSEVADMERKLKSDEERLVRLNASARKMLHDVVKMYGDQLDLKGVSV
jgi:hypothetical protein